MGFIYLYLFIGSNTGSSVLWKSILQLWLFGVFKLGTILTKKLLKISGTFSSSDIISSEGSVELSLYFLSIKVIFDLVLTLSNRNGFKVFQKVLFLVATFVLRLLKNCSLAFLSVS